MHRHFTEHLLLTSSCVKHFTELETIVGRRSPRISRLWSLPDVMFASYLYAYGLVFSAQLQSFKRDTGGSDSGVDLYPRHVCRLNPHCMDWRLATNAIHALNDCFGASFMFTTLHIHSNKVGVALEVNLNFGGKNFAVCACLQQLVLTTLYLYLVARASERWSFMLLIGRSCCRSTPACAITTGW